MRKILVLRLSSMGDVIVTASLFSYLKANDPEASITLITQNNYAPLFADDPRLAGVIGITPKEKLPPAVLNQNWDNAVDLQNSRRSRNLLGPIEAKRGYFDKLHGKRLALLLFRRDTYAGSLTVPGRYIEAATGSSPGDIPVPSLFFSESGRRKALADYLPADRIGRPLLALFPFSAWKNKEWPGKSYAAVGRHFMAEGWVPVVMGGEGDAPAAQKMQAAIGGTAISLAGRLTLYECGALITGFSLALGNDTGLAHLSRACGVRTGIFFGPTTRHFGFFPFGDPAFRIFEVPLNCRPCHAHGGNRCLRLTHDCMRRIEPEQVIRQLEELSAAEAPRRDAATHPVKPDGRKVFLP